MLEFAVCSASSPRPRIANQLAPRRISRYDCRKDTILCRGVVGPLLG